MTGAGGLYAVLSLGGESKAKAASSISPKYLFHMSLSGVGALQETKCPLLTSLKCLDI